METRKREYIPKAIRERVLSRFGGRCGYCGQKPKRLQVDHIVPHEYRGTNEESNLMPSCASCNNYKGAWPLERFRREIAEQTRKLHEHTSGYKFALRYGLIEETGKPVVFHFEQPPFTPNED